MKWVSKEAVEYVANQYELKTFWSEEDNSFITTCPSFKGMSAFGDTEEESTKQARIVVGMLIEQYIYDNERLPPFTIEETNYDNPC